MIIIRTGKERVRNLFDVKVVQLIEDLGWDQKYEIGPVGGYEALGGRMCNRHQKIFNLMSSLIFFIIVICFQYISTT